MVYADDAKTWDDRGGSSGGRESQVGTFSAEPTQREQITLEGACDAGAWPCTGVCCGTAAPKGCALGKCTGKPSEHCGGKGAVVAYTYKCEKAVQPGDGVP